VVVVVQPCLHPPHLQGSGGVSRGSSRAVETERGPQPHNTTRVLPQQLQQHSPRLGGGLCRGAPQEARPRRQMGVGGWPEAWLVPGANQPAYGARAARTL
jgi:hypothetical protein